MAEINVNAAFIRRGKVKIPAKVLARLEMFGDVAGEDEYGMYLSATVDPIHWTAEIDPDIFEIPPQRVSPVSIRMLEVPDDLYDNKWGERCFNAVVHRHPGSGPTSFSGTDEQYINRFFEISFIYQKGFRVNKCIMNRREDLYTYTQLECDVEIIGNIETLMEKEYPVHNHHNDNLRHHNGGIFFPPQRRVIRTLEGFEEFKAEITATEHDMNPEHLKSLLIRGGYTEEEKLEGAEVHSGMERFLPFMSPLKGGSR